MRASAVLLLAALACGARAFVACAGVPGPAALDDAGFGAGDRGFDDAGGGVPPDAGPPFDAGFPADAGGPGAFITIGAAGILPVSVTVPPGGRVTFQNADLFNHRPASDPHPAHTTCPELNLGVLVPGASATAVMGAGPKTCAFHDDLAPASAAFRGSVTVR